MLKNNIIWQNDLIFIEIEANKNPWLKVFTHRDIKEFSSCTADEKSAIWQALDIIEKTMLNYYQCDKVNIASFGNILPKVHFHITARFKNDDYFPNPMWGEKLRDKELNIKDFAKFIILLQNNLNN